MVEPALHQARELILNISTAKDAKPIIDCVKDIPVSKRGHKLTEYYNTAEHLASKGDTKAISVILRVLEYFGNFSHDRMLLHYIAEAAANHALHELKSEDHPNHKDMLKAITLISMAFADANKINAYLGIK